MVGLSVKLWQEGGEEDFCLLLPGLSSVTLLLNALLEALAVELEPKDFAQLSSQIPSSLLSPSNLAQPQPWSAAATWNKTQQNLKLHTTTKTKDLPHPESETTKPNHITDIEKEESNLSKDDGLCAEEVPDLDFISDLMETESSEAVLNNADEEKDLEEEWGTDSSNSRLESETTRKPRTEFECNVCGTIFPLLKELRTHQEENHKELYCSKCGTASSSLELVRMKTNKLRRFENIIFQVSLHNCSKPHCCQVCHRLFSSGHELKSHSYIHR